MTKSKESEQEELFPECAPENKKKLRRLLGKMEEADAAKKAARQSYDEVEQDVIEYVRDELKVMPDANGDYRLRLDADETITIGRGKAKVSVKRVTNNESDDDAGNDDDFPDATDGAEPELKPRKGKAE
jgi:hypothetical protein